MDMDSVDAMIFLVDYPQTKSEAFALARHSYAVNGVFEINEVPKVDAEENEEEEDAEAGSDDEDEDDDEDKSQQNKLAANPEEQK